VHAIAITN